MSDHSFEGNIPGIADKNDNAIANSPDHPDVREGNIPGFVDQGNNGITN